MSDIETQTNELVSQPLTGLVTYEKEVIITTNQYENTRLRIGRTIPDTVGANEALLEAKEFVNNALKIEVSAILEVKENLSPAKQKVEASMKRMGLS